MFTVQHNAKEAEFMRKLGISHKNIAMCIGSSHSWSRHAVSSVQEDPAMIKKLYELLFKDENSNLYEELVAASVEKSSK